MLNAIAFFIPFFLLLIIIEWYVSNKRDDKRYHSGNTTINMTIGAIDQIMALLYLVLLYLVLQFTYENFRLVTIDNTWYHWILAFIAVDFLSYWYHLISHKVNIFWAGHVTHHSSEKYNFSISFRLSFFQAINRIIFWAFLPLLGFSPLILIVCLKINGIYQFFLHTEYAPKLGFLERIIMTPSMHRVHHGRNEQYIDKNYGSCFVIWDKIFGTYEEEVDPVDFGIKGDYTDNNPIYAITHHYIYLWKMLKEIPGWGQRIKFLFMPPDFKPVQKEITRNLRRSEISNHLSYKRFAYFQIGMCVVAFVILLVFKDLISIWEMVLFSLMIVIALTKSSLIMNNNIGSNFVINSKKTLLLEICGLLIILYAIPSIYSLLVLVISLISLIMVFRLPKILDEGITQKETTII